MSDPKSRPTTLGGKIDRLYELREEKRQLMEAVELIDAEFKMLEEDLMLNLDTEESRRAEGKAASVSISESVVGRVTDWDALFEYVRKKRAYHLLQRRTSDPAVREMFQLRGDKAIPGVEPFVKRTLNLRRLPNA